ncbi:helix-turn-helix transcriptional regulator [Providencia rustigianii]|uniref:helix-turn-helix transcriptional regulator n=1 Tax=Providencia rustigianii TaxID=158850 RepID=UPI0038B320ED
MSTFDPIDLDVVKQVIFKENQPNILNNVYFWMITDQKFNILSCSSQKRLPCILNSIKIPNKEKGGITSIELIIDEDKSIAIALNVLHLKLTVKNEIVYFKLYDFMKTNNIKFNLFEFSFFNKRDGNNIELSFCNAIERLKKVNPINKLTKNEWAVAWLVIHGVTSKEISKITGKSINTINKTITRILGVYKLELFDRDLLSDVGFYLRWDCYIPLLLIRNLQTHISVLYKKTD